MKTQRGAAMVEFAMIALVFFMILFGIIEFGRLLFTYNTLVEATRRGARVAAVCPVSADGIAQVQRVTTFKNGNNTGTPLLGLATTDIKVTYFGIDPSDNTLQEISISDPTPDPITLNQKTNGTDFDYLRIQLVRVEIRPSFTHTLFIPGFGNTFSVPSIQTTLPSESLGRVSGKNPVDERCCYNACTTEK